MKKTWARRIKRRRKWQQNLYRSRVPVKCAQCTLNFTDMDWCQCTTTADKTVQNASSNSIRQVREDWEIEFWCSHGSGYEITFFCDVTSCTLVETYRRFEDTGYSTTKWKTSGTSDVSVFFIKIKTVTPKIKYKKAQELNSNAAGPQKKDKLSQETQNINTNDWGISQ